MKLLKHIQITCISSVLILLSNCGSNAIDPIEIEKDDTPSDLIISDLDEDGIINEADSCDTTPSGALIDAYGCRIINEYDPREATMLDFSKWIREYKTPTQIFL